MRKIRRFPPRKKKKTTLTLPEALTPDFDRFVAFDLEATGSLGASLRDKPSEICEIGAVRVEHGTVIQRFDLLCNPGRKMTPFVVRITGITDEMLRDAPSVPEAVKAFAAFAGDDPLVGHNLHSGDLHYLAGALDKAGITMENTCFDTFTYAKRLQEERGYESLRLQELAKALGILPRQVHRAEADAETTALVYLALQKIHQKSL